MTDEVFDLDALEVDRDGKPFPFRHGGEEYELPAHFDMRAVAALDGGNLARALHLLLGEEQWERIEASPAPFNDKHFKALLDAYTKHLGLGGVGESKASSRSSKSTAGRSKPTSSTSMALR